MATIFSHGFVSYTLSKIFPKTTFRKEVVTAGVILAMLPDADVITFGLGIPYESPLGHRGLTHSILFALLAGIIITLLFQRNQRNNLNDTIKIFLFLFFSTVSHGVLDAFTSGGLGVGFFIPLDDTRYFFPWRPILVSPIGVTNFVGSWGLAVLKSEFKFIWLPGIALMAIIHFIKKKTQTP